MGLHTSAVDCIEQKATPMIGDRAINRQPTTHIPWRLFIRRQATGDRSRDF